MTDYPPEQEEEMTQPSQSNPRPPRFAVSIPETWLSVEEIWPDGGAPEHPTAEDVAKVMREYGAVHWIICEWNLAFEIEIFGHHDASRATAR